MALTTVNVSGRLPLPDDTNPASCIVEFLLSAIDTDAIDDAAVIPAVITTLTDGTGSISINLWPNDRGIRNTWYSVTAKLADAGGTKSFSLGLLQLQDGVNVRLEDVLSVSVADAPDVDFSAAQYAALAQLWAEEAEDVAVEPGKYSAFHWAQKAMAAAYNPASVAITGGSINGVTIGAGTPSTGAFTTLTTTGNVGVGTISPGARLEVANTAAELRLRSTGAGDAIIRAYVNAAEAGKIGFTDANEVYFEANGAEALRIDSSRKITINGTSGHAYLNVIGPSGRPVSISEYDIASNAQFQADSGNLHSLYIAEAASGMIIQVTDGTTSGTAAKPLNLQPHGGDLDIGSTVVMMSALPTSDPSNTGQLWNNSGAMAVSA